MLKNLIQDSSYVLHLLITAKYRKCIIIHFFLTFKFRNSTKFVKSQKYSNNFVVIGFKKYIIKYIY